MPFAPSVQTQEVPRDFDIDDYVEGEDSEAEDADHRQTRKPFFLYILTLLLSFKVDLLFFIY